nr:MAG TPA: hypothetical protein [Caudoviricetes sp.]
MLLFPYCLLCRLYGIYYCLISVTFWGIIKGGISLSKVNDRSLSTNPYYIGFCAPALCLCSSLLLGNHQRQHRHRHRQQRTRQRKHQGPARQARPQGIGAAQIEQLPPAADRRQIVALWL